MNKLRFVFFFLLISSSFLFFGVGKASAAPALKILNDSDHAYSCITNTINLLLGPGVMGTSTGDIEVDQTNLGSSYSTYPAAFNTATTYYDEYGNPIPSAAPYNLFSVSFTEFQPDSSTEYDLTNTYDFTQNYAYTNSPPVAIGTPPPAFQTAPGISGPGTEWAIDTNVITTGGGSISCETAANAGIMASLRYNHPSWNWFDVKAALRQTGTNWTTGYNPNNNGFGTVEYAAANAFTNSQLLLQPPVYDEYNRVKKFYHDQHGP